ncbi:MAG: hypothetical protein KDE54_26720, partial [Caldilineaceae bacterium]|nr:hypothetical protein [Caldilineaceae bacterium]
MQQLKQRPPKLFTIGLYLTTFIIAMSLWMGSAWAAPSFWQTPSLCADIAAESAMTAEELATLESQGDQLRSQKQYTDAIKAYCQVLAQASAEDAAQAGLLNKLAEVYRGAEQDSQAVAAYEAAITLYTDLKMAPNAAGVLEALGRHHNAMKRGAAAVAAFEQALALRQELDNDAATAGTWSQLAGAYAN